MEHINYDKLERALEDANCNYSVYGNRNIIIKGFCSLNNICNQNSLFWIKEVSKIKVDLNIIRESAVITPNKLNIEDSNLQIVCDNPKQLFFYLISVLWKKEIKVGVSASAVVLTKNIGDNVYIGENSIIGEDVVIGENCWIGNNVSITNKVQLGNNVHIQSGVTIGEDGLGVYVDDEGHWIKAEQYGGVEIGDNVEIFANASISRGTIDNTIIGNNVRIGNSAVIGHNVIIGFQTMVGALTCICGSTQIGENVYIAPGTNIINQIKKENNSIVGIGATVTSDMKCSSAVIASKQIYSPAGTSGFLFKKNGLI